MLRGHLGEQLLQPGVEPREVFEPLRQDTDVDEHLPDDVQTFVLRELVKELVGNRAILSGQLGHQPGGRAFFGASRR